MLGSEFEQATLELRPDTEGDVFATLVHYKHHVAPSWWERVRGKGEQVAHDTDVLYVHGWSDYFFQRNLAEYWAARGANFYALDLRKFGRSLRDYQTPGFTDSLGVYDEEIEFALKIMGHGVKTHNPRRLVLMGHSMGGLILSLWADRNPGRINGLVLNSPWLEYQLTGAGRAVAAPVVRAQARLAPKSPMPNVDLGFYYRSISAKRDGEWEFNEQWRPERAFATRPAWLTAILDGHAKIAQGLNIDAPVLVLLSDKSLLTPKWSKDMMNADVAIDVNVVSARAHLLGHHVTIARIPGGMHDLVLSKRRPRQMTFDAITHWLKGNLHS